MPKLAANLTFLYTDSPFLERFDRAAASGFRFIEYLFPYDSAVTDLQAALKNARLSQVLFNLPAGKWLDGERGIACLPGREPEFRRGVDQAIEYGKALNVPHMNCLVGKRDPRYDLEEQQAVTVENLRYAAGRLEKAGFGLLVEMINPFDIPGFLVDSPQAAFDLLKTVNHPNLKVQFDVYHAQRTQGELANTLQKKLSLIGHIQIADNPGRHQPGSGEINYRFLLNYLDAIGYSGTVGLEYNPDGSTEASLGWIQEYGLSL